MCDEHSKISDPAASGIEIPTTFLIQRPTYPDWFVGWNACGPIWSSKFSNAHKVRPDMLVSYMIQLAKYEPIASLSPNVAGERPATTPK